MESGRIRWREGQAPGPHPSPHPPPVPTGRWRRLRLLPDSISKNHQDAGPGAALSFWLRPAGVWCRRTNRKDLACARPIPHILGPFPLGSYHEQRLAVSSAQHTRKASVIQSDRLEHLSSFTHTHAVLVSNVGIPESTFGIKTNPVGMIIACFCPDSPMREATRSFDIKGREPIAVGLSHD